MSNSRDVTARASSGRASFSRASLSRASLSRASLSRASLSRASLSRASLSRDAFAAIADSTRREILDLLREQGSLRAGEIADHFKKTSRPGISRHLRVLKECGVVSSARVGKTQNYTLCPAPLVELRDGWLAGFSDRQNESLARLRNRVESRNRENE